MMIPPPPPSLAHYWEQLRKPLELEILHGCQDTAILGASIAVYAQLWAQRLQGGAEEDARMALSIARGLRDYATMPVAERKRRAMAAIDMLRMRAGTTVNLHVAKSPDAAETTPTKRPTRKKSTASARETASIALPVGYELLEMPIAQLAPRAQWPKLFASRLNLYTVRDLLYHIPRDWLDIRAISELVDTERAAIVATVTSRQYDRLKSAKSLEPLYKNTLVVHDDSAEAWITSIIVEPKLPRGQHKSWSPARLSFREGQRVFALGKVDRTGKIVDLRMEDIFEVSDAEAEYFRPGNRVPVYPLTAGTYQNQVHRAILRALTALGTAETTNSVVDPLPTVIREQYNLLPLLDALLELHQPSSPTRQQQAHARLAFEEFLVPQLILARRRWEYQHEYDAPAFVAEETLAEIVTHMVSFAPTSAQLRVLAEIESDLRSAHSMNRLLQGDVGSGKTLVAAGALAFTARSGAQAAIMAPTEILAEQLYIVLTHLLRPLGIRLVLLTGTLPAAERRETLAAIASGEASIAVGTHALIQDGVVFHNLGLSIIDEQHRFGVEQRATLRSKGRMVNSLVMTATPIPRTLSLTLYGDLDVSVLDEMPPGRHPVETRWLSTQGMREAYLFIRSLIAQGRQAYVLCPLVEQSELLQADAATDMAKELQHIFPDLQIGLLHGRLRPEEKDAAMEAFRNGVTQILACTTVIEVGVDVPNAAVILIHNAERFGLAQLHQLRGRVGRSQYQSYCMLATHPRFDPTRHDTDELPGRKRLRIMLNEQDGFAIAEADLEIRGPGEYFGTRQSGLLDFHIGSLPRDVKYLEMAREAAQELIADDPTLKASSLSELRRRVQSLKSQMNT